MGITDTEREYCLHPYGSERDPQKYGHQFETTAPTLRGIVKAAELALVEFVERGGAAIGECYVLYFASACFYCFLQDPRASQWYPLAFVVAGHVVGGYPEPPRDLGPRTAASYSEGSARTRSADIISGGGPKGSVSGATRTSVVNLNGKGPWLGNVTSTKFTAFGSTLFSTSHLTNST